MYESLHSFYRCHSCVFSYSTLWYVFRLFLGPLTSPRSLLQPPKPAAKGAKPEPEPEPVVIEEVKAVGTFMLPDGSKYEGDYIEKDSIRRREGKGIHTWNQGRESYVSLPSCHHFVSVTVIV